MCRKFKLTLLVFLYICKGYFTDDTTTTKANKSVINIMSTVSDKWTQLPVDHFDPNDERQWLMRYIENLKFWQPDGPIYIYVSGETEATKAVFTNSQILIDLAEETHGAMYVFEHRYYGKSKPLNVSKVEDLQFLTINQTLADMITVLNKLKSQPQFKNSKVVFIGGSYGGNLVTWLKERYPDSIDAVFACSAPLEAKVSFDEYNKAVAEDYVQYGSLECLKFIADAFKRFDELLSTNNGTEELKKEHNICDFVDMSVKKNQHLFFSSKRNLISYIAQYKTPEDIKQICIDLLSNGTHSNDEDDQQEQCNDYQGKSGADIDFNNGLIMWSYQQCTELGYFFTTYSKQQPFGHNAPREYFYGRCSEFFGSGVNAETINEGVKQTNKNFGGKRPNVTHVVFTQGALDPWRRLGVMEDLSPEAPARVTPAVSHCRDLREAPGPNDPPELAETMKWVKDLIKKWIGFKMD